MECQKQDMTEAISDVYDIGQPTLVSLEKLSAIAVSLEIWRRELNEYRKSHTLDRFDPYHTRLPSKVVLPELPSAIYNIIHKYIRRFGVSVNDWITVHCLRIFKSDNNRRMNILKNFDDFVCDYDGAIHYVRTAERLLRCDRFDDATKFNIACTYFLEDDIRRLWPFVSKRINADSIDFDKFPHMYYWICRLTNKLDTIIPTGENATIDEEMFDRYIRHSLPSLEYFWNGLSREKQIRNACEYYKIGTKTFITIILPKLDDQLLDKFVNKSSDSLMWTLLCAVKSIDEELVLGTWSYIRNIMNESMFQSLVDVMIGDSFHGINCGFKDNTGDYDEYKADDILRRNRYSYLSCDIWNNSPPNLKASVIRDLLPGTALLKYQDEVEHEDEDTDVFEPLHINVELLLLILRCASIEERSQFWHNCWHLLIASTRGEELQRIMNLCFETREHEMAEFKQIMARSENVRRLCVRLLREGEYFNVLNELASFILPEMHNARNFKQQIIRECLILRPRYSLEPGIVRYAEKFNGFITSAFGNVDLSTELKNRLIPSASGIRNVLWSLIRDERVSVQQLITFVDTFVSAEEIVVQIKMSIVDSFKKYVTASARRRRRRKKAIMAKPHFTSILFWCLGSDEEVDKFKLTCAS